jgi:hypothetical protein
VFGNVEEATGTTSLSTVAAGVPESGAEIDAEALVGAVVGGAWSVQAPSPRVTQPARAHPRVSP